MSKAHVERFFAVKMGMTPVGSTPFFMRPVGKTMVMFMWWPASLLVGMELWDDGFGLRLGPFMLGFARMEEVDGPDQKPHR